MPKFSTIGYGDAAGGCSWASLAPPVQVRNHGGAGVSTTDGPFMVSQLPVAGFAVIDADTLEEAVAIVSSTPCAVAHGVVEVWPLETQAPDDAPPSRTFGA